MRVLYWIDWFSEWTGRIMMWLALAMVFITAYNVFERYVLNTNTGYLIELNWHFYSLIFLLGAAYTLKHDGHVRVDLVYHKLSPQARAWVNLLGTLFFLIPVSVVIIYTSLNSKRGFDFSFVGFSWHRLEGSPDPGGLPARYLLKSALPLGFSLLIVQGIGEIIRSCMIIRGKAEEALHGLTR